MTIEQELIKSQAELSAANQEVAALRDQLGEANEKIAALSAERNAFVGKSDDLARQLAEEKQSRASADSKHAEAIAAKGAEVETLANKKLHERATKLGIKAVPEEASDSIATKQGAMKRAEFDKLNGFQRVEFAKSGGKLVD